MCTVRYEFHSGAELCRICAEEGIAISEVMLRNELEQSDTLEEFILAEMQHHLQVMRASIAAGLDEEHPVRGAFSGGDALKMARHAADSVVSPAFADVVAASMAVVETNAAMGRIVAAPTAGASGILPAVLVVCAGEQHGLDDEALVRGLFTAGAIGAIVAEHASIAGASGGCQAETGTAAAMAAAALAELMGATPEEVCTAAAIALKNCLGLVCDPVAGLVECPCIKRNAIGVVNALVSADMVLAGIGSLIPFDEVVGAMQSVGDRMATELKETALGGLAATDTGRRLAKEVLG